MACSPTVCRAVVPVESHELGFPPALYHHPSKTAITFTPAVVDDMSFDSLSALSPTSSTESFGWDDE